MADDKVVDLAARRPKLVPRGDVPELLSGVLSDFAEQVRAGGIQAVAIISIGEDGEIGTGYYWDGGLSRLALLGGLTTAQYEMATSDEPEDTAG